MSVSGEYEAIKTRVLILQQDRVYVDDFGYLRVDREGSTPAMTRVDVEEKLPTVEPEIPRPPSPHDGFDRLALMYRNK